MLKKYLISSLTLALVITAIPLFSINLSQAAPSVELPEQAGVYNVSGNPHLKLRVFTHPANNQNYGKADNLDKGGSKNKPLPTPPTKVCQNTDTVDLPSTTIVDGAGWKLPATWTYYLNLNSVPTTVGSNNLASIAKNAYASWLAVPAVDQKVIIIPGGDTTVSKAQRDNKNIVAWGKAPGNALAISYIWYNTSTFPAIATEVDTIMNVKFSWYWSDPSSWSTGKTCAYSGVYDAQNIMTHEFGHTFGLDDEYTDAYINNTMYGYGSTGETNKNTLTDGDKTGVANLYQ